MTINKLMVERIAHLAKIHIETKDIGKYAQDLSEIIDLFEKMNSVATTDVEPLAHPQDIELRLRPDQVTEEISRNRFQDIAPETERGLYLVPKIIE
jgi:aspartyl-tRNA(Asn)/glutamyl-tRNA(Gln) amidotransferase subunit C